MELIKPLCLEGSIFHVKFDSTLAGKLRRDINIDHGINAECVNGFGSAFKYRLNNVKRTVDVIRCKGPQECNLIGLKGTNIFAK